MEADDLFGLTRTVLTTYERPMQSFRRFLFDQFTLEQVARKVVGVGSVGTPCLDRANRRR